MRLMVRVNSWSGPLVRKGTSSGMGDDNTPRFIEPRRAFKPVENGPCQPVTTRLTTGLTSAEMKGRRSAHSPQDGPDGPRRRWTRIDVFADQRPKGRISLDGCLRGGETRPTGQ